MCTPKSLMRFLTTFAASTPTGLGTKGLLVSVRRPLRSAAVTLLLFAGACLLAQPARGQDNFMPHQDYQVWRGPFGIIARDLDSNGYDDLAVTNSTDREDRDVSVLYGQPAGGMGGQRVVGYIGSIFPGFLVGFIRRYTRILVFVGEPYEFIEIEVFEAHAACSCWNSSQYGAVMTQSKSRSQ